MSVCVYIIAVIEHLKNEQQNKPKTPKNYHSQNLLRIYLQFFINFFFREKKNNLDFVFNKSASAAICILRYDTFEV